MKWLEISVRVNQEDIEIVSAIFDQIGTGGVVIEDPAVLYHLLAQGNKETVAIEEIPDPDSLPVVKGYLPADDRAPAKMDRLRERLMSLHPHYANQIDLGELEESSWQDKWREFYEPVRVGGRLLVKPSWIPVENKEGLLVIEMDPGMAFGCGTHPTTTLCMGILEDIVGGGETVLDVGTGSGILSITAAKLGAVRVVAVDSDPIAVRVARENVECNGLSEIISVQEGDLLHGVDPSADIIVANIVADVILRMLPSAALLLREGGKLIASGIIASRGEEVTKAILSEGLRIEKTVCQGEWTAFLVKKTMTPQ